MSQDREFETYMQGKSGVSQAYAGLPALNVPDHLDAAILAEAHRAVGARPGAKLVRRWTMPLSMAASVFLVVMVGLQLSHLPGDTGLPPSPGEEKADVITLRKFAAPDPAPARGLRAEAAAPPAARARAFDKPAPVLERNAAADKKLEVPAPSVATEAAPAPEPAAEAPMQESAPPLAIAAAPMEANKREGAASGAVRKKQADAAVPKKYSVADGAVAFGEVQQGMVAGERPQDWLKRIERYKKEGRLDEARKELAAFRKRYPDYPIPETLELR